MGSKQDAFDNYAQTTTTWGGMDAPWGFFGGNEEQAQPQPTPAPDNPFAFMNNTSTSKPST